MLHLQDKLDAFIVRVMGIGSSIQPCPFSMGLTLKMPSLGQIINIFMATTRSSSLNLHLWNGRMLWKKMLYTTITGFVMTMVMDTTPPSFYDLIEYAFA